MNRDSSVPSAATVDSLRYTNTVLYHQLRKAAEDQVHATIDTEVQGGLGAAAAFPIPKRQAVVGAHGHPSPAPVEHRPALAPGVEVRGFIGERMCVISLQRGEALRTRLQSYIQQSPLDPVQASCVRKTLARLHSMLEGVNVPPPLPAMVFGKCSLPPSPSLAVGVCV